MGVHSADHEAAVTRAALDAARGDGAALDYFVRATHMDVWRFVVHLGYRDLADDLTQETFARAIRSLPGFTGRSTARTWLLSIARRTCVDEVRRSVARPRISATADWTAAAESRGARRPSARWQEVVEVKILLEQLPEERRAALVLTQVLGLSYQEAADVLDCPIGTVRSRVARAREALIDASSSSESTRTS